MSNKNNTRSIIVPSSSQGGRFARRVKARTGLHLTSIPTAKKSDYPLHFVASQRWCAGAAVAYLEFSHQDEDGVDIYDVKSARLFK